MTPTQNLNIGRIAMKSIAVLARSCVYGVIIAMSIIGLMFTAQAYGVGQVGQFGIGAVVVSLTFGWALMNIERWKAANRPDTGPELVERDSEWETVLHENDDGYGVSGRLVDGGVELRSFNHKDEVYQNTWIAGGELETVAEFLNERAEEDHL